ncbi:hypothetical protein SOVF_100500 [Spinacia oleracea]|nr:hypothetical protein SOVF_100500 [Spinacia oleracea]
MLFVSQLIPCSSSVQHDEHASSYAVTNSSSSRKATNEADDDDCIHHSCSWHTRKLAVMFRRTPRFIPTGGVGNHGRTSDASKSSLSLLILLPLFAFFFS